MKSIGGGWLLTIALVGLFVVGLFGMMSLTGGRRGILVPMSPSPCAAC